MNLEEELRSVLKEHSADMLASPELKERIMSQVSAKQGGSRMKKWILSSILAAALLVPTGAFAAYNYLADTIYGSRENVTPIGGTVQRYDELESKLQEAKQILSEQDFTNLMSLLKQFGDYSLKIADSTGTLHPEKLSTEDHKKYTELTTALESYFNKLNLNESPKIEPNSNDIFMDMEKAENILSEEEFADFNNIFDEMKKISDRAVDSSGEFHHDRLSEQDILKLEQLEQQLRSYLDKVSITTP